MKDRTEPPRLFVNTHPVELVRPGLLESLEELRAYAPHVDLVLEIHESALAEIELHLRAAQEALGRSTSGWPTTTSAPWGRRGSSSWRRRRPTT